MRWATAMALLAASSFFLYVQYGKVAAPPPAPPPEVVAPPAKAAPFMSEDELQKVRRSARDPEPGVRWAALELLYTLGDAASVAAVEKAAVDDIDPEIRLKAVKLLSAKPGMASLQSLRRGVADPDKGVRLASIKAMGDLAEPAAIPALTEAAANDYEPEVRVEAMRVLGKFADARKRDFAALADKLRRDYEAAVERSQRPGRAR